MSLAGSSSWRELIGKVPILPADAGMVAFNGIDDGTTLHDRYSHDGAVARASHPLIGECGQLNALAYVSVVAMKLWPLP